MKILRISETLRYMYKNWPFLPISLVKCGHGFIQKPTWTLLLSTPNCVKKEEVRNIYQIILHEWQLTKDIILMIEEQDGVAR